MLGDERNWLIGLTRLGSPVFNISGGAPEDGGEGEDEGEGEETEEEVDEVDEDYTPPTKDEFARIQAALKKANREAANRRHLLDKHGIDPRTGLRYEDDGEGEEEVQPVKAKRKTVEDEEEVQAKKDDSAELDKLRKDNRVAQKRAAQREALLTDALSKKAASAALAEAGWNGQGKELIERMIDLGDIQLDDEGEIIGLAEQVLEVKQAMPGWFKQVRTARRVKPANGSADVDGADKVTTSPAPEPIGWLQKLENQLQGVEE